MPSPPSVMKITSAAFVVSAVKPRSFPRGGEPELAFIGRSNVGKSSLINSLLNRRGLAQTSRTPGKTRVLNFFLVNESFYFVDMPGYGYARLSRAERSGWKEMVDGYLVKREQLRGLVLLVDIRHPPSDQDCEMKAWLDGAGVPSVVVATKADKISKGVRARHLDVIRRSLPVRETDFFLPFSSRDGFGKDTLWSTLINFLEA